MKPVSDAWAIQIEVTNACILSCASCTRNVRHIDKPFFTDLETIEKALQSLEEWDKPVGLIGGEPTIHPKFAEICGLMAKYIPKKQRGLWTAGGLKYEQHKELIDETFGIINFNNHKMDCYHQPMLISSEEIIPDVALRKELINNCWLQREWSPSIGPNGAFFCEVAQSYDILFDEKKGMPIEKDWWKKDMSHFQDQVETFCNKCSICIPFESHRDNVDYEYISRDNLERLKRANSPFIRRKKVEMRIFDRQLNREDIEEMKKASKLTENKYVEDKTTANHYFFELGRVDSRLSKEENQIANKIFLEKERERIAKGELSLNELARLKKGPNKVN